MLTVPNLVSGLRVLAVPYFWYVLLVRTTLVGLPL